MVGPDAGIVRCEVDGAVTTRLSLLDKWAYFWRLAVVTLAAELPPGEHHAVLTFEREVPDAAVLARRPAGPHWEAFRREGKQHKLWMMHWLVEETSERERALVRPRGDEGGGGAPPTRLGGAGMAAGGRRADS